jgi:mono/diheme cytochrome c family protein
MRRKMKVGLVAASLLAVAPVGALAAPPGDVARGKLFAEKTCAGCHAVEAAALRSPHPKAPTFASVAATPGMSAAALGAALQTTHKLMPNLVFRGQSRADVIAYVLSLKPKGPVEL